MGTVTVYAAVLAHIVMYLITALAFFLVGMIFGWTIGQLINTWRD